MDLCIKIKIFIEMRFLQRADVPLMEIIKAQIKILPEKYAPKGRERFYYSLQPDGELIRTELESSEPDLSDEDILRKDMGDTYVNALQQEVIDARARISQCDAEIQNAENALNEIENEKDEHIKKNPDYDVYKRKGTINMLLAAGIALGEIGALLFMFLDLFGLDPMRLGSELQKHPFQVSLIVFLAFGYFMPAYLIARQTFHSQKKALWLVLLAVLAITVASTRASQASALNETQIDPIFLTFLFAMIGFALPLAVAYFVKAREEAWQITATYDSTIKQLNELERRPLEKLHTAKQEKERWLKRLEAIKEEIVAHYKTAQAKRKMLENAWESYGRFVQAYIAWVKLAYLFWTGWPEGKLSVLRPAKRFVQAVALLLIVLIVILGTARVAHSQDSFNIYAACDRSTSGAGYSCTPEALQKLGQFWSKKADEAGGGTFELFLIDQGFDTTDILFSESYPERFPGPVSVHKKQWREDFLKRLAGITLPNEKGSAMLEAIMRILLRVPSNGETYIYVLSDLREVNGAYNFEKQIPSEGEFLSWIDENALIPRSNGATKLIVCGVHPYTPPNTSRMTAKSYEELLNLWHKVFEKWGVQANISEKCDFKGVE